MLVVVFSSVTQVTLFNYDLDPAGIHLFWLLFWVIFCWLVESGSQVLVGILVGSGPVPRLYSTEVWLASAEESLEVVLARQPLY